MKFEFAPVWRQSTPHAECDTFTIARLWEDEDDRRIDITHLFDRGYEYQSAQELQWYLAERFRLPVGSVSLSPVATTPCA